MPAYNFKKEFVDDVESGFKKQTIRPKRKYPTMPGSNLSLYTGMRTSNCRLLKKCKCLSVQNISIDTDNHDNAVIVISGRELSGVAATALAIQDGFIHLSDFVTFFADQYGLPFNGDLIKWA